MDNSYWIQQFFFHSHLIEQNDSKIHGRRKICPKPRTYEMINQTGEHLNCHAQNLVYVFICSFCSTQYVGETAPQLNMRMNCSRTTKLGCGHIIYHFKISCGSQNVSHQILEKLPGKDDDELGDLMIL